VTHAALRYNAPLRDERAHHLVSRVLEARPVAVADFGCGRGEFLLDVLAAAPEVRGMGVDLDDVALAVAREAAAARGLDARATFVVADASHATLACDVSICIGASHAFGGLRAMLDALPGRRAIVGDGYWAQDPDEWCRETFGELPDRLHGVRDVVAATEWRAAQVDASTLDEWDAFEAAWRLGVEAACAAQRKDEYETRYRGVLGFMWLVLDRSRPVARLRKSLRATGFAADRPY
jgi:SAM-dependent methyltransferase